LAAAAHGDRVAVFDLAPVDVREMYLTGDDVRAVSLGVIVTSGIEASSW
jgi:hypothetical protein